MTARLPARSIAVPVALWLDPSVATTWSGGHVAMPAPASEQAKCTVTVLLFHPFAFGAGVSVAVIDGGPRSILIGSLVTTCSGGHVVRPAPPSVQVKCTVTVLLFHPFAFFAGLSETVMTGGPKSILMGSLVTDAVLPALSVAVPRSVWLPSVATTAS